jgi:hypothetical protein
MPLIQPSHGVFVLLFLLHLLSCPALQYLPHVSVTAELLMCAAEQLPRFTPHSLALMLWALGGLRMKPNKEWMVLVLAHIEENLQ